MADLTKLCKACCQVKPIAEFYLNKGLPQNPCKTCVKDARKKEYADYPEKIKAKNKKSHLKHRDERLATQAIYRQNNKAFISNAKKDWWSKNRESKLIDRRKKWHENKCLNLSIAKQWREKNKEWIKNYNIQYSLKNKSKLEEYRKDYYNKNKESIIIRNNLWKENNKEQYAQYKKAWTASYRATHRKLLANKQEKRNHALKNGFTKQESLSLFAAQKGLCNICKTEIANNYHHDHIMPLIKGGSNTIENIQLLCPSCNLKKGTMDNDKFIEKMSGVSNVC